MLFNLVCIYWFPMIVTSVETLELLTLTVYAAKCHIYLQHVKQILIML